MTIIVFILFFAIFALIVVLVRERVFQFRLPKKEAKEEKDDVEEKSKKVSSSSSGGNNDVLVGLMYLIIIIVVFLILGALCCKIIDTVGEIFSTPGVSVQEKTEWRYCEKEKSSEPDCRYNGYPYIVKDKDFKYLSGKKLFFKVSWGIGSCEFRSDVESSSVGSYYCEPTGEEGRFSEFRQSETDLFTAELVCRKNCRKKYTSFTLDKK